MASVIVNTNISGLIMITLKELMYFISQGPKEAVIHFLSKQIKHQLNVTCS